MIIKKLIFIILILGQVGFISLAHGEVDDSFMSTVTLKNVTILGIGIILALIYGGGMWAKLTDKIAYEELILLIAMGFTGFIHIAASRNGEFLLLANGVGFLLFVTLYGNKKIIPINLHIPLSIMIIMYTLVTITGYFMTHDHYDIIAISTKISEVGIILLLLINSYQSYQTRNRIIETA